MANLTGRKVVAKFEKRKREKVATKAQREVWGRIADFGCIVCGFPAEIHHCGTGAGGRKNHDYVIGLCFEHHRGKRGIDGKQDFTKTSWQNVYGAEKELHEKTLQMLAGKKVRRVFY